MDEILSLLFNPDFQFGVIAGISLSAVSCVVFLALIGVVDEHHDRRRANALDQVEHHQRTMEAIRYGEPRASLHAPEAANDATLDLRDAYRRPQGRRAEMRSGPR
ncbi:MAG: hypothetical protein ACREO4_16210 [Lysobacter sp.]